MEESFYVGAYWGPRAELVDVCAEKLARQLASLASISPIFATWFEKGNSRNDALKRPIDPSHARLRELLIAGQQRTEVPPREVMTALGFSASMWNGQDIGASLSASCSVTSARVPNVVLLKIPRPNGDAASLYRRESALGVVRSMVSVWEPQWCTWTGHLLRQAVQGGLDEIAIGWATYVADTDGVDVGRLPAGVSLEALNGGLLVVGDGDADSMTVPVAQAVREVLDPVLRPRLNW
jgi:hypothetical protein